MDFILGIIIGFIGGMAVSAIVHANDDINGDDGPGSYGV